MSKPSIGVLIIEDDPVAASVYEQLIKSTADFTVVGKAETAAAADSMLNVITPELILLDIQLPDANGIDLLFQLKQTYRNVDIIMITAANDAKTVGEAMRGGAFTYILKPIMVESFLAALEEYHSSRQEWQSTNKVKQEDIQRLFKNSQTAVRETNAERAELPKGIDKHTLRKVVEAMRNTTHSLNAEEVGGLIGASHSTSRRYLEYLVSQGQLGVDIVYGQVGRPERKYKQTNGR